MSHTPHHTLLGTPDPQPKVFRSRPKKCCANPFGRQVQGLVSHQTDSWSHHTGHFVSDKGRKLVAQAFPTDMLNAVSFIDAV